MTKLPELSCEDLSNRETLLWQLLREREECILQLKDEIARLKGEKGKPKIKPSRLEPEKRAQGQQEETEEEAPVEGQAKKKRPGSAERHKTASLPIHETTIIQPTAEIPPGSEFRGYQDYTVQELIIKVHNTRYRLAIWKTLTGEYLSFSINRVLENKEEWLSYLKELGIEKKSHVKTATEGALLGAVLASGVSPDLGIISDGAGQFRLFVHGLCWVHAERLINKLIPFSESQRLAIETVQDQIWSLYQDLKNYKNLTPDQQQQQKALLEASFDQIFTQNSSFETLNQVLRRLVQRKAELLKVLDRPELPLHNNVSEQDLREFVTKRKISGSTRSDEGRRCRDTFAAPQKDLS